MFATDAQPRQSSAFRCWCSSPKSCLSALPPMWLAAPLVSVSSARPARQAISAASRVRSSSRRCVLPWALSSPRGVYRQGRGGKPCRRSSHHCFMPRGYGITGAASRPGNGATAKSCHAVTCATQFGLTQVLDLMNKILAVTYLFLASSAVSYAQPAKRNADSMTFLCADSLNRADGQPRKQTYCKIGSEYCYEATGGPALSHGAQCKPLPTDNPSCSGIPLLPGGSCSGNRSTGIYVRFAFP